MEIITYKTNVSSEAALNKITPILNQTVGPANWGINLCSEDHKLSIYSPGRLNETLLKQAFRKAGIKAVNIEDYYSIY
jgi:hypothetical protein